MVYRGKLSTACGECRTRKTRCDAERPSCGQCRRAGRICHGYQDTQRLRILNQTQTVVSKASWHGSRDGDLLHTVALPPAFPCPLFVLARTASCIFFAEYSNALPGFQKTEFDFVSPLYEGSKTDGMLAEIVASLGIVALARRTENPSLMLHATRKYSAVLRQTQIALGIDETARSDETLATVSLLALHELITKEGPQADTLSSVHLNGASKLLQLRGGAQFHSGLGRFMFSHLTSEIVMNCLQSNQEVYPGLMQLMDASRIHLHIEAQSQIDLLVLASRLCTLICRNPTDSSADNNAKFRALIALDDDLAEWTSTLSPRFAFFRPRSEHCDAASLGAFDVYENHVAAALWNKYRCIRIQTNEEILYNAQFMIEPSTAEGDRVALGSARALSCIGKLVEDICYSVPFFLDRTASTGQLANRTSDHITMYGGSAVIKPLSLAAKTKRVSPETHEWITSQIKRIDKDTRIVRVG